MHGKKKTIIRSRRTSETIIIKCTFVVACIAQERDMVELLVARNASMEVRDQDGRTPLHAALGRTARGSECARVLLAAGANPNEPDNYGYTSVHLAALNEFASSVKMLLGKMINVITNYSLAPLSLFSITLL